MNNAPIDRSVPTFRERLSSVVFCGVTFFAIYGFCNWTASLRPYVPSFAFPWEASIPFVAWMIVPYMSVDLLFGGGFLLCKSRDDLRVLRRRVEWCVFISALFFLLLPLRLSHQRPEMDGVLGALFSPLVLDQPFNMFPSLHISFGLVFWGLYRERTRGWSRAAVDIWFPTILLSTLFVWQHHVLDLVGGAVVGYLAFLLFPSGSALSRPGTNAKLGLRYLVATVALVVPIALWPWTAWVLAWPAASLLTVAFAYLSVGAGLLGKQDGKLPLPSRILLAPWLLGCWLSRRLLCRDDEAWSEVTPGVWIGRSPDSTRADALTVTGATVLLDVTAECSGFRDDRLHDRRTLPLLDFTAPGLDELRGAVDYIDLHRHRGVLVHCALGYCRSAAIAAAWLMSRDPSLDVDGALRRVGEKRPQSSVTEEMRAVLSEFDRGRAAVALRLDA